MARFLIMAQSNVHKDVTKDEGGCYKRGDIVDVRDDLHVWGKEECWPKFLRLNIPGLRVELVKHLIDPDVDLGLDLRLAMRRRRLWGVTLDVANLPKAVKDQITTGQVTVTVAQIRNYIKNKVSGANY